MMDKLMWGKGLWVDEIKNAHVILIQNVHFGG